MLKSGKFVIHEHLTPQACVHWDLMLEADGGLETYRLPVKPDKIAQQTWQIEKIFDHPLKFLEYEGPVNNGLGKVTMVDSGTFEVISKTPLLIKFRGEVLNCTMALKNLAEDKYEISIFS